MTTTTYRLSNRQRKELLVRGQQITIAIPANADDEDAVAFAKSSLPEDELCVSDAEWDEIAVLLTTGATDGLTGVIGEIKTNQSGVGKLTIYVMVCVVTLTPPSRPRGKIGGIHWPGSAIVDGVEIPQRNP